MKKIIVYVALMISSLVFSQNAFDKLEDKEGVESIVVSKKMFQYKVHFDEVHHVVLTHQNQRF